MNDKRPSLRLNALSDKVVSQIACATLASGDYEPEQWWRSSNDIGNAIPGQGIYFGRWEPRDRDDRSLGLVFNVFAAPEDLRSPAGESALFTFNDAVKKTASLTDWHGHKGLLCGDDAALLQLLRSGEYKGEWFIPTSDLLGNVWRGDEHPQIDHLYVHRDRGALKGTFKTTPEGSDENENWARVWYWSCTESNLSALRVRQIFFSGGDCCDHIAVDKNKFVASCRLTRAVLVGKA